MAKRFNPKTIGIFVIGALVLAVTAVMILGSGRLFRKTHEYVMFFKGNVNGLRVGAAVKFKGVEIGSVTHILINLNIQRQPANSKLGSDIKIPVLIELDETRLASYGAKSFDLDNPETMKVAIRAGLRAQLAMESLLTGLLYVDLDMHPDTPANLVLTAESQYQEIPTLPTALEQAQSAATRLVSALNEVDFPKLIASLSDTLDAIKSVASSPELKAAIAGLNRTEDNLNQTASSIRAATNQIRMQIGPLGTQLRTSSKNADATLKEAQASLASLQTILAADSPLIYQSTHTLEEVSAAARSVRELAEYLQRNPNAILRGRDFNRGDDKDGR